IAQLLQSRGHQSTPNLSASPRSPSTPKKSAAQSPHPLAAGNSVATTSAAPHPINSVSNAIRLPAQTSPHPAMESPEEAKPIRHNLRPAPKSQPQDDWKPASGAGQDPHPINRPVGAYFPKPRPNRAMQHQRGLPSDPNLGAAPPLNGTRWTRTASAEASTTAEAQQWHSRTAPPGQLQ